VNKLRLILWEDCNRNCSGCCNKDWDIKNLPVCTDFTGYDEILLTGGEPMLYPDKVEKIIREICKQARNCRHWPNVYMYTAELSKPQELQDLFYGYLDGVTITLHEPNDFLLFKDFSKLFYYPLWIENYSFRLNVFKEVGKLDLSEDILKYWKIKENIEWIKNCPLPDGETLMRWKE